MEKDWKIIYAMPNLTSNTTFEIEDIGIVPYEDYRIKEIAQKSISANIFINSFRNEFSKKILPTFLIINNNGNEILKNTDTLSAFRNIAAVSVCLLTRSNDSSQFSPYFSDSFDFYPLTLAKDNGFIIYKSSLKGFYSETKELINYKNIQLPNYEHRLNYDSILYDELLKCWIEFYLKGKDNIYMRRLFRSLQIVYNALSLQNKNEESIFDFGLSINLWISGFEILANNQRYGDRVSYTRVCNLLENYVYSRKKLNYKKYILYKSKKIILKGNIAQMAYVHLYKARNAFSHGNRINKKIFRPFKINQGISIYELASIIYRFYLCSYLFQRQSFRKKFYLQTNYQKRLDNLKDYFINSNYEDKLFEIFKK